MKGQSFCVKLVMAGALLLPAPWLCAQDGLDGSLTRANQASLTSVGLMMERKLAVADFDNDHKPDGAVLVDSGRVSGNNSFHIELHFSGSNNTDLAFSSAETTLAVTAWDVNKDGATDVIVEHPLTHKRLFVWLNDGRGGFHRGRIEDFPSPSTANGERLEASSSSQPDCPAVCLGPQRDPQLGILTAHSLTRRDFRVGDLKALLAPFAPASPAFSPNSSRAPPLS